MALFVGAAAALTACQEDLATGAACPALCPDTLTVRDTVLTGRAALDTTVTLRGFPPIGAESRLLLADYVQAGSPVRTVAVLRFDSLQRTVPDTADTTKPPAPIVRVDSVGLFINIEALADTADSSLKKDTITFLVYDVDADAPDLDTAATRLRFAAAPIAQRSFERDSTKGQLKIPLDSGFVATRIRAGKRIRLGVRATSKKPLDVRLGSENGGGGASLRYAAIATSRRTDVLVPVNARSAVGPPLTGLADFTLVLAGTPPPPAGILAVGGIPASRAFLRFALSPFLLDSVTIVRANLELHAAPNAAFESGDTISLQPLLVRVTTDVTDLSQAALLSVSPASLSLTVPNQVRSPLTATLDTIPLVSVVRLWKTEPAYVMHAIVLSTSNESFDPRQYYFYSNAAADSLRPRLRLTYIPTSKFGLP